MKSVFVISFDKDSRCIAEEVFVESKKDILEMLGNEDIVEIKTNFRGRNFKIYAKRKEQDFDSSSKEIRHCKVVIPTAWNENKVEEVDYLCGDAIITRADGKSMNELDMSALTTSVMSVEKLLGYEIVNVKFSNEIVVRLTNTVLFAGL